MTKVRNANETAKIFKKKTEKKGIYHVYTPTDSTEEEEEK